MSARRPHATNRSRSTRRWVSFLVVMVLPNATLETLGAQLVTPRTVPVQQSGQFDLFPSERAGMAGVAIALDDTVLDPFVNPAKATRLRFTRVFSVPGTHTVSAGGGRGRTMPVGTLVMHGAWAGGGLVAAQQLERASLPTSVRDRTTSNRYLSALVARRLAPGLSAGLSGYRATLDGMDGLDLLYAGNTGLDMSGELADLRLGVTKDWKSGRSAELLLLHGRTDMSHDVTFPVRVWDPNARVFTSVPRFEHNDDRTRVWGIHTEASVPLDTLGSRIGWLATANHLSHPKIPNYPLMNVPRDPGTTWAFNLGFGTASSTPTSTTGFDIIYEPMFSETWADAARDTETAAGTIIPAGGRTVENRFRFTNFKLRAGTSRAFRNEVDSAVSVILQLGVAVSSYHYRLSQRNNVERTVRNESVGWIEWGPTAGVAVRGHAVTVGYTLQLNCSPGSCNPLPRGDDVIVSAPTPGPGGVIAAPTATAASGDFRYGRTLTHRLSVSLAIH